MSDELESFRSLERERDGEGFIVEGEIAVRRLLESDPSRFRVHSVVGTATRLEALATLLARAERVFERSPAELRELVGFDFHRGCLAHGSVAGTPALLAGHGLVLVAEGLADPRNLGAVIRNARAFGVSLVVADSRAASPYTRRAIRAAMGHCFALDIASHDPRLAVTALSGAGFRILAASTAADATSLASLPAPRGPEVLLVGNEGNGLSAPLLALAHLRVRIPMAEGVDSLNVAAATAILLHARSPVHVESGGS